MPFTRMKARQSLTPSETMSSVALGECTRRLQILGQMGVLVKGTPGLPTLVTSAQGSLCTTVQGISVQRF